MGVIQTAAETIEEFETNAAETILGLDKRMNVV